MTFTSAFFKVEEIIVSHIQDVLLHIVPTCEDLKPFPGAWICGMFKDRILRRTDAVNFFQG